MQGATRGAHIARWLRTTYRRAPRRFTHATGLTGNGAFLLIFAAGIWIGGRIVAGRPLYLLAYGGVAIVVLAWISARAGFRLRGERIHLAHRTTEGEVLDVAVKLTTRRHLSTVILEERLPEQLGQTVKIPLGEVHRGETTVDYKLDCWRRGSFTVGPMVARYGDPVGLVSRERLVTGPYEVLVHPTLEVVRDRPLTRQFEDPPLRPKISRPWPTGLEFYGMRELRPGDDLRRVVWRVLARSWKFMVREAEQGVTDKIVIILNTSEDGYPRGEEYSPGFETAVRVAASLGVKHLDEGYQVTLEAPAGPLTPIPLRGQATRVAMLDALARVERTPNPLSDVLLRLAQAARRDIHNVLVTARLDRREAAQLRLITRTGISVLVVVVKYGDRYEEAAHNAAALGCQVIEAVPGGAEAGATMVDTSDRRAGAMV